METILLEEMTWTMVERAIEEGFRTVVVPVGSIEQHGPHLPLGTDTYLGDCLGRRLAERLGNALVAPTIRPGCSGHHLDFPGTISVSTEALIRVVEDVCASLDRHGFENIILLPSHGGNFAPVQTATQEIAPRLRANLIALADLEGLIERMREAAVEAGVPEEAVGGHSGAGETSFVMAYRPELVRSSEMAPGYIGPLTRRYVRRGFKAVTETGVLGDPRHASREIGERFIELVTEMYLEELERELGASPPPGDPPAGEAGPPRRGGRRPRLI